MTDLQYPIGRFQPAQAYSDHDRQLHIKQIEEAPAKLRSAVEGLEDKQLDMPYREGGWTVRQVVHHLADSHMNAFVHFRIGITEDQPAIKSFDWQRWAELADAKSSPVEPSLMQIESMHKRFTLLLRSMSPTNFARTIIHPEQGVVTLDHYLALYAWHGRHHIAHITSLRERQGLEIAGPRLG